MNDAITIQSLTKSYGTKHAVSDVSFSIEGHELFGLLGVNEAGKTTLIKMLSCLTKLTSGVRHY